MPQLDLLGAPVAHQIDWQYRVDPLKPLDGGRLLILVGRGKGTIVESAGFTIAHKLTHEVVESALSESWQGYLFGEPGDAVKAASAAVRRWERFAKAAGQV